MHANLSHLSFRDWSGVYAYEYYDDVRSHCQVRSMVVGDGSTTIIDGALDLGHISGTLTGYQGQSIYSTALLPFTSTAWTKSKSFLSNSSAMPTMTSAVYPPATMLRALLRPGGWCLRSEWYDNATIYR